MAVSRFGYSGKNTQFTYTVYIIKRGGHNHAQPCITLPSEKLLLALYIYNKEGTMAIMGKSEYARHRRVSPAAITKHVKNGVIVVDGKGKIDSELTDWILDQYTDRVTQVGANPTVKSNSEHEPGDETYAAQRTRLTKYKAELAKIELARQNDELVDSESLKSDSFSAHRKLRDGLYSFVDSLSGPFAAESDPHKLRVLFRAEIDNLLTDLTEEIKHLLPNPSGV
jgi:phage terminase Nu1 subunit (DNA packaging protein)